jgi:N utilization substance protein B
MQMLFQGDLGKQTPEEVRKLFWPSRDDVDAETRGFAEDLHRVASTRQAEIDGIIEAHSQNWRIERMPVVDRNLLRTAIAEMLEYPNTPAAIVINESLEVAKRYAAPESIHFLNGVLDAIARDLLKERLG